jgi:hypothetical protein
MFGFDISTIKTLLMLDKEFDKVVEELIDSHEKMESGESYDEIAYYATKASKLEKKAENIFVVAKQLLED